MERISTGVGGLDRVLGGGLPRQAIHILGGIGGLMA